MGAVYSVASDAVDLLTFISETRTFLRIYPGTATVRKSDGAAASTAKRRALEDCARPSDI